MWLAVFLVTLLLGVTSDRVLGAPTPSTASRLDDDESRSFWKGWLLVDDPALAADSGRKKGQITPKSVFIAPVIKDLPDCAPGYRADALGRCHRLVKIDQTAQLSFLLQKLNAMYANNDRLIKKQPTSTEGPLQVAIPFASFTFPSRTTTPEPVTTTTEPPPTEEVDMVVVAAEVEVKDEEHHQSTSVPGAIVTLWHLNSTTTPPPETSTVLETTTLEPSTIPDEDLSTLTTQDVTGTTITDTTNTETTQSEDGTTQSSDEEEEHDTTITTTISDTTIVTTTEPPPPPKTNLPSVIPLLSVVHTSDSDVKIVDNSDEEDLSSEADRTALTLELPNSEVQHEQQGGSWNGAPHQGERFRWPHEGEEERRPQQVNPWTWGAWHSTTPRPLYHNFWASMPQVPDPTIKTRQVIRRPPSRYPATFNGRPAPLYYQELSGQEVAHLFNHQHAWHQQRHHG